MLAYLLAAAAAAQSPANLDEAAHALAAGRFDQARMMIAQAIQEGAPADRVERLLADLDFASGNNRSALARYEVLLAARATDAAMLERAATAALRIRSDDQAAALASRAADLPGATWRSWNVRAVAADRRGDWAEADRAYGKALTMAPDQAEAVNNYGWSLMLRRRWSDALEAFERAAALDPKSRRIADNLDLARAAVADELPMRRSGESDDDWAARLNDAGVIARAQGRNDKAIAAFARAIEARAEWFGRAANNLSAAQARR